jgi:hypothetical protein
MSEPIVIRRFNYRHEAEIVRSMLASEGIDSMVTSDDCGAVDPALGFVRGISLAVESEQADRARALLEGRDP